MQQDLAMSALPLVATLLAVHAPLTIVNWMAVSHVIVTKRHVSLVPPLGGASGLIAGLLVARPALSVGLFLSDPGVLILAALPVALVRRVKARR